MFAMHGAGVIANALSTPPLKPQLLRTKKEITYNGICKYMYSLNGM